MTSFRVKYSVKGITGMAEMTVSASLSMTAKEIVINQNGGKDKVTIWSVNQVR